MDKSVSRAGVRPASRAQSKLGPNPSQTRRGSSVGMMKIAAIGQNAKILGITEEEEVISYLFLTELSPLHVVGDFHFLAIFCCFMVHVLDLHFIKI